jgi:sec-independent protein translocase protein TatC
VVRLRPVAHDEQLTVVEHLEELRARIVVSLLALAVAFGFTLWRNHEVLEILNDPLPDGVKPVTLSPTEPFLTTLTLALYAAILLALPVILYQVYAFVLPAFSPSEKRVALPLLLLVPVLFVGGVAFCYFVVLPPAIDFLLGFNADEFTTELRAREYYSFAMLTMISVGILFQVPIGVLVVTRLGVVSVAQLRRNRRYAILGMAVLAALLPTVDPITMLIEMVPLVLLYELSILLAAAFGRPAADPGDHVVSAEGS